MYILATSYYLLGNSRKRTGNSYSNHKNEQIKIIGSMFHTPPHEIIYTNMSLN